MSQAKTVVVTGASAGVGRATAVAFARRGWNVALIARGTDGLEGAKREVESAGGHALVIPTDVADSEAVFAAADRVAAEWGAIDVWVNVAMVTIYAPVHEISPEEFRRVTEVTYLGQVHGTLAALKHMRPRNAGTIVQVGSALSYRAIPLQSAYCAAKFAIRGFTDALRCELEHEGSAIRITMAQLPAVNTPQFDWARSRLPRRLQPVPPIHQPEPVAEAIFQASQDVPREVWIGLSSVKAIVGTMVMPEVLDHMMASMAWNGQMTSEPARPDRPDNLFTPVPGDFGTHGRFDDRSYDDALPFNPQMLRAGLALAALGLVAGAAVLTRILDRGTRASSSGRLA